VAFQHGQRVLEQRGPQPERPVIARTEARVPGHPPGQQAELMRALEAQG
jgi:hypothetical protein